ncbi:MAG: hypothetical protein GXW90_03770 [Tepidanaerobacter acetatoxydans]|jgi:hypothetical protein|uniref:hypothetical protein n=1 Tax=Tepidanaerobacter TaxID=499228 RepID=UPI000A455AD5|nr:MULTISPECIES: hypothetical protein [Tepidanaerobacter]NLU10059.1 hypothetical protein [Tepidanaerobacter acetatoxydans]
MKKKERFTTAYNNKVYEVAGRWEDAIILSPVDPEDDNCLIYTAGEIAEFLLTGRLQKETEEKRAFFGRKIADLEALKELTQTALGEGQIGFAYQVTNRTWLLHLGMIGDEYKTARKVLLPNPFKGNKNNNVH